MLIELLQSLYRGELPVSANDLFYQACVSEIERSALWGQVHYLLRTAGFGKDVPKFFVDEVTSRHMNIAGQNLFVRHQEDLVLNAFEADGIEVIPLKGTRFAERFFGHPAARGTSDIDLMIHPEELPQVADCLRQLGYSAPETFNTRHYHCTARKQIGHQEMVVELHWSVVKEYTSNVDVSEMWNSSMPVHPYKYVREFPVPYVFYTICLHGANHEMDSPKHYLDAVQLLYKWGNDISYEWLLARARQDKTLRRVQMVLSRVYSAFPELWNVKPLPVNLNKGEHRSFTLQQYDSWIYRARVIKDWVWPKPEIARWFLKVPEDVSHYQLYATIYAQRFRKAIWLLRTKVNPVEKGFGKAQRRP